MKKIFLFAAFVCTIFSACEKLNIDETPRTAPVIGSFSPMSAPKGAEVVVLGEYLNNVTKAYIGEVEVEIVQKVSDSRLSIRVAEGITKGRIVLENGAGKGSSEQEFICSFAVPEITASLVQASADMGEDILISGKNLNAVVSVLFNSGDEPGRAAKILQQQEDEIVVTVPYVRENNAKITLTYYGEGSALGETPLETAPEITVVKYTPSFDEVTLGRTAVGKSIVLSGKNLNYVEKVAVGGFEASFSATANSLSFTIPAGDFGDGDHTVALTASWFDGNESRILAEDFVIYVPFIKFWENLMIMCQGRTADNNFRSFFSPETGIIYENSVWKTELDPVAAKHQGAQWQDKKGNQPKPGVVSDEEYDSVVPYFFISGINAGQVQINSPANSNGQLKNFFINASNPSGTASNDNRVSGTGNNIPGTPILTFRYLDSANPTEAALIEKVRRGEIDNINEETFPIDEMTGTVGGIAISSAAGTLNTDVWCKDYVLTPLRDTPNYVVDAVILVMYYSNCGYDPEAKAKNIRRLGLLHIKTMDWKVYSASSSNYALSSIYFDCYWQKYDYDYSKLNK